MPYPGTTQQLLAAAAGTLQFTFDTPGNSEGLRDSGKVIGLAVTGAKRSVAAPNVPTFKELGYDGFDDLSRRQRLAGAEGHLAEGDRGVQRRGREDEHERRDPRPAGGGVLRSGRDCRRRPTAR